MNIFVEIEQTIAEIDAELGDEMTATDSLLLVLDNDRQLYERCMSIAVTPPSRDTAYPVIALADAYRDFAETLLDDITLKPDATVEPALREGKELIVRQLLAHVLQDVEWREVAEHYLAKVTEQNAT